MTNGQCSFHQTLKPILFGQYVCHFGPVNRRTQGHGAQEIAYAVIGHSFGQNCPE